MTLRSADRVRDTTTTTGTGTLTVSGTAPIGYRAYSAIPGIAANDKFLALISHQTANEWEVSLCTYNSATAIARTTVLSSSNAGALVNFSAGTKDVVLVQTSEREVLLNDITVPLVCGGDAISSTLTLQSTSGAGTTDTILFKTGSQLEAMRIDTAGRVTIGGTANITVGGTASNLEVAYTSSASWHFTGLKYSNDTAGTRLVFAKSRSGTLGTNTIVQLGDELGSLRFYGANGTDFDPAAMIQASVDTTPGASNDMPGNLSFWTTPNASATLTERMAILSTGQINAEAGIASTTTTTGTLVVTGGVGISGAMNAGSATLGSPLPVASGGTGETGTAWTTTTPTPVAGVGTFTSASSIVREKKIGKICYVEVQATITTVGTGSSSIQVAVPTGPGPTLGIVAGCAIDNSNGTINMVCQVNGATMWIIPTASTITSGHTYYGSAVYEIA
jgi:hypothetical protein